MLVPEINHLFQNLFDDPAPASVNRSNNTDGGGGGEGPTEEEVVTCLEQLVTGHSPSQTQVIINLARF